MSASLEMPVEVAEIAQVGRGSPDPALASTAGQVGRGSPDPALASTAGLTRTPETSGRPHGTVGRPCQNECPKSWPFRLWYALCFSLEWLFGLASLLGCLAVLAAIPILNFLTLGYMLEASGSVAKSGRIRDGFIDIGKFARIGSLVAGTWLCLLLPRLISSLATDAWLIDPEGVAAGLWRVAQIACTVLVVAHVLLAWYSGGRLRHFFWPLLAPFQLTARLLLGRLIGPIVRPVINSGWPALADDLFNSFPRSAWERTSGRSASPPVGRGSPDPALGSTAGLNEPLETSGQLAGTVRRPCQNEFSLRPLSDWFPPAILLAGIRRGRMLTEARDAVWDFVTSLRLPQRFWLGLRGFAGALAWLIIPSLMLIIGTSGGGPPTIVIGFLGALAMAVVALHLPFLEVHFACQNRLLSMFEPGEIRAQFRRAPIAFWFALVVTLLFALPLYLLKIEPVIPPEFRWMLTLIFVLFIYPARLLTGWAVGRALHHDRPRLFAFRWLALAAAIPVVAFYVFIVFFAQYTSFVGPISILEQHAFLLPVPLTTP
jgi:hypothetical protein